MAKDTGPPPPPTEADEVWSKIVDQETRHRPGLLGPVTPYGQAEGEAQVLPQTAQAMAKKLGVPWRPELMTGKTDEAEAYQLKLGRAYFDEGVEKYGGDLHKASAYYYGGPDENKWGPKTRGYVGHVMGESGDMGSEGPDFAAMLRAPGGPNNPATIALQKKGMAALGDADKAQKEAAAGYGEDIKRYEKMLSEHPTEPPLPPTLKDLPKPPDQKDYIKDPKRVLGQFLPVLAILGSAFTRNHATTAMSAAAAAMNAAKQNDKDEYERANGEWKNSMEKALNEWKMESDRYRDALENDKYTAEERQSKLQIAAALSNSRFMREAAQTGQFDTIWKALQMGDTAWYKNMQVMNMTQRTDIERQLKGAKLEQQHTFETALKELRAEPEYQQSDGLGRAKMEAGLTRQLMPNFPEKQAQIAHQIRGELERGPVGKAYGTVETYEPLIENAAAKVQGKHGWDKNPLSSSEQAAFLDGFTRMVTGGQAIRGFTLKLNTEHASLAQKAERLSQSVTVGGPLSIDQIRDMIKVAREYSTQVQKEYEVEKGQAEQYAQSLGMPAAAADPFSAGSLTIGGGAAPAAPGGDGWSITPG